MADQVVQFEGWVEGLIVGVLAHESAFRGSGRRMMQGLPFLWHATSMRGVRVSLSLVAERHGRGLHRAAVESPRLQECLDCCAIVGSVQQRS